MPSTTLIQPRTLDDVDWPDDAIFVVDAGLPDELVTPLAEPVIAVDAGEALKSMARIEELAGQVLNLRQSRPLTLVAVGGGSIGDAVGFLASILWRGVRLWHVPTTLVAMVDSAHGGKTAVNLGRHKNQLGTFHTAQTVVVARSFLDSLPLDLREEGLVELLKVLWLDEPRWLTCFDDADVYHQLLTADVTSIHELWTSLIAAAVDAKNRIVDADPHQTRGPRRVLNLGHTAGHALEAALGLPHGRAIAWGLAACAHLSVDCAELDVDDARRLLNHLEPLLVAIPGLNATGCKQRFVHHLRRDKKHRDGRLISILLDGPAQPVQTDDLRARHWWDAVRTAERHWRKRTLSIAAPETFHTVDIALPPDKSRQNRAAAISHLRGAATDVSTPPGRPAADAVELEVALDALAEANADEPLRIDVGEGGTTGRFLLAISADRPGPTKLDFAPALRRRLHAPLVDALIDGGASIESTDTGFSILGWSTPPTELTVDASSSSQFASALALLSAAGHRFELHIEGPVVSQPYFEMTVQMLGQAGVHIDRSAQSIAFAPGPSFDQPVELSVPEDTSAGVVWRAVCALTDHDWAPSPPTDFHPDQRFEAIAERLVDTAEPNGRFDLGDCPDLCCVLAALAASTNAGLTITGARHLHHKESNRIDDTQAAFREVGIDVGSRPDGLAIGPGRQRIATPASFDPRRDHRLAMAGLVLATAGESICVEDAGCVAKSYPDLWRHARRLGYRISDTTHLCFGSGIERENDRRDPENGG